MTDLTGATELRVATTAKAAYASTREFYDEICPELGASAFGFEILYGPPVHRAPIVFLGYQPGGAKTSDRACASDPRDGPPWPTVSEYAHGTYRLAARLRFMFDGIAPGLLSRCTGLNSIFFRAPSVREFEQTVSGKLRARMREFCSPVVDELIEAIDPSMVVVLGFSTLRSVGHEQKVVCHSGDGKALVVRGQIGRRSAFAIPHPTGARVSNENLRIIGQHVVDRLQGSTTLFAG